jgi:hypothetical protein
MGGSDGYPFHDGLLGNVRLTSIGPFRPQPVVYGPPVVDAPLDELQEPLEGVLSGFPVREKNLEAGFMRDADSTKVLRAISIVPDSREVGFRRNADITNIRWGIIIENDSHPKGASNILTTHLSATRRGAVSEIVLYLAEILFDAPEGESNGYGCFCVVSFLKIERIGHRFPTYKLHCEAEFVVQPGLLHPSTARGQCAYSRFAALRPLANGRAAAARICDAIYGSANISGSGCGSLFVNSRRTRLRRNQALPFRPTRA